MRYLKTFESHNIKQQIIDQVNQTIDDAMRPLEDEGFEESTSHDFTFEVFKKYTRNKKTTGLVRLNGTIDDGKIKWMDDELYEHWDHDIVQEFLSAIHIIQGIVGIDIKFSFTNYYEEDKIVIYTRV